VVEFETLGGMGGRERQGCILAAQLGDAAAVFDDRRLQRGQTAIRRRPTDHRRQQVVGLDGKRLVDIAAVRVRRGAGGVQSRRRLGHRQAAPTKLDQNRQDRRIAQLTGRADDCVHPGVLGEELQASRPERQPHVHRNRGGGQQLGVGARQDRPTSAVVRPAFDDSADPDRLFGAVGRQDEPTRGFGRGGDRLGEPLAVAGDQAHRPGHDRRRAAVVDRQVHPRQAGQVGGEPQHAPHVCQSPTVDGLIVVADEKDAVRRRGQQ
jgi:hypothetical protein